jgi:hypothetical protein
MLNDSLKLNGELHIQLFGEDGQLKDERNVKNLVVQVGKNFIASRAIGTTPAVMSHMAVGTSTTAAASADTALALEIARVALSDLTVSNNVITHTATYPAGVATGAITEAGILNAASAGTLLARTVFAVVNKGAADSITITWNITVS